MDLKEYIVTLKDRNMLDDFYNDMETPGGNLYIPDRCVDVAARRPISRNTHYLLTEEEASLIANDERVVSVELTLEARGIEIIPSAITSSNSWDKKTFSKTSGSKLTPSTPWSQHKNWGLLRSTNGSQTTNWGDDSSPSQSGSLDFSGVTGRNVDVVIIDGHIDPNHPEYAKNPDGSGGSRVVQYNWFQHKLGIAGFNPPATYVYEPFFKPTNLKGANLANANDNHGAHVAGTVAGNTQGWAKNANIYNLHAYSTSPNGNLGQYLFDYVRAFHAAKPINPKTGKKNPTICNCSWGYGISVFFTPSEITSINFRGSTYYGPFDSSWQTNFNSLFGIQGSFYDFLSPPSWYLSFPLKVASVDADIADAIADGIIVVVAAGNENRKIDIPEGTDYNNYLQAGTGTLWPSLYGTDRIYYHRGHTPGGTPGVISVGAIGNYANDRIATFSNHGPRIDVFAPGEAIMSSVNNPHGFRDGSPAGAVTTTNISNTFDFGYSSGIVSNTFTKSGTAGWNAGGKCINRLDPGGGICFVANQTTSIMAVGLSTSTSVFQASLSSLSLLDYGFYLRNTGNYDFVESGNITVANGMYTTSTVFRVEYNGGKIIYKTDESVVRSVTPPSLDADSSYLGNFKINSASGSVTIYSEYTAIPDPRNSNYYLDKIRGTSMASPQVTGMLACMLENYPTYTQTNCLSLLVNDSKIGQITDYPNSSFNTTSALRGAPNRYLYFNNEPAKYRDTSNTLMDTDTHNGSRKSTGMIFPRSRIKRT